jgi:hypothetical protein
MSIARMNKSESFHEQQATVTLYVYSHIYRELYFLGPFYDSFSPELSSCPCRAR